ncbi:MAG: DNA polymerase III subunit [Planctomycetota bacterium]|jgi:DNA polymerase-3 subunit delta'
MSLKEVFCQDKAIGILQRAYAAQKVAHAYIFVGPDGVGKFKTAREWAKLLLCNQPAEQKTPTGAFYDNCDSCRSCEVFRGGAHPDFNPIYKELVEFTKDGKGKTPIDLPIGVIREFLIDKVAGRPQMSDATVYVVREAERLNQSSQNALLKVLEEPPKHCFIILICSRLEKMLPTTQSRCQIIRFGPVDEAQIVNQLIQMDVGPNEAQYWAAFSQGSLGAALVWAGLELKDQSCYEIKTELVRRLAEYRLGDTLDFAEWLSQMAKKISGAWAEKEPNVSKKDINRRAQTGLIRMTVAALSDAAKLHLDNNEGLANSSQISEIEALAEKFDVGDLVEKITKAYENMQWVQQSVNERLIFEELLLSFAGCGTI